ncbi:MIF4G like-domain-containing protein [Phellopilus nigrolimitatus]|nr:MIF4G like-domain-containing protein [Phellopilus nigrolimitatus]
MSYNRHYGVGRRKSYRDDYDERLGREVYETPEQRLRTTVIRFGEVDADQEVPKVARELREQNASAPGIPAISEGFRIGVTEEPYKIPHYAALLRALDEAAEETPDTMLGKQVLDDFWKGFQVFLDKLAWREVRLCVHFFAHLTSAQVISAASMLSLLQSFTAVLDEFGVSHSRAKNAALCAAEGLMRAGPELKKQSPSEVSAIITAIQTYAEMSSGSKLLASPLVRLHSESDVFEGAAEILDSALEVLKVLDGSEFSDSTSSFVHPYTTKLEDFAPFFDLPSVLVPPEVIELESLTDGAEDNAQVPKNEEWPEYRIRLFDNDVSANPVSPLGYAVNTLLSDVIDIFEVNRKECARILLEIPKWLPSGTFKARPGVPSEDGAASGPAWQLESCVMECILAKLLVLPRATHKSVYYIALITELCKLQPSTAGPAVGKSIRKLYNYLGDGLDVEAGHRFAEWFATHMSNFGFAWVWKEWIPDLSLTNHHPKRNFMRRAIEIEIRLALPAPMKPHHDAAQSVLHLLRGRAKTEDINAHIETLRNNLAETTEGDVHVDSVIRAITIQSLLHIGSRSFSHFLNAIERYLPVLRALATGVDAKADILQAAAEFWRRNPQMVRIVFDKLMQYQIVDPSDVIGWAFAPPAGGEGAKIDTFRWEIIEGALDKANGRVVVARKKVSALRKEEDDSRAREKASGNMEVTDDAAEEAPAVDSPALTTALKACSTLTREQRAVLSRTLNEFVNVLGGAGSVLAESAWFNRVNWSNADWGAWDTWGWYRNFCRMYAPYLRSYSTALGTVAFVKIEGSTDPAPALLKRVWNVSTGQEA